MEKAYSFLKYCKYCIMLLLIAITAAGLTYQCKTAILTAPDEATLQVTIHPSIITVGGQALVKIFGYKASGSLLTDGTVIFLSCSIGSIDPSVEIVNGKAQAIFKSDDNRTGTADIKVISGNATVEPDTNQITIVAPVLESLVVTAYPSVLPAKGGTSNILGIAYDENMNPLAGIPIVFTTNAGNLASRGRAIITNNKGEAKDTLETETDATVIAFSGDVEGSTKITVKTDSPPTAAFFYSPANPTVGENVYFNALESNDDDGTIIRYEWDFGDGRSALGSKVSHRYATAKTYRVLLVVTDNGGNQDSEIASITVSVPAEELSQTRRQHGMKARDSVNVSHQPEGPQNE